MQKGGLQALLRCRIKDFSLIWECRCSVLCPPKSREIQSVLAIGQRAAETRLAQSAVLRERATGGKAEILRRHPFLGKQLIDVIFAIDYLSREDSLTNSGC